MPRPVFLLAWTFILGVAAYDTYFAWRYRAIFLNWEMNALACWLAQVGGLGVVFAFKALGMAFATIMAVYCHRRRHRLLIPFTLIIGCAYLWLAFHYVAGHLDSPGY
jgi:hypothetical protein